MTNAAYRFDNRVRYRAEDHDRQVQLTPAYVLDPVREALGGVIGLDPCTIPSNPVGAERFSTPPQDGASLPWARRTIYVNPPYGKVRDRWVGRCMEAANEGRAVVLLIPAATDTRIWQRAYSTASSVVLVRGRLKFELWREGNRRAAASHPSSLVGWNVDLTPCAHLGSLIPGGKR